MGKIKGSTCRTPSLDVERKPNTAESDLLSGDRIDILFERGKEFARRHPARGLPVREATGGGQPRLRRCGDSQFPGDSDQRHVGPSFASAAFPGFDLGSGNGPHEQKIRRRVEC